MLELETIGCSSLNASHDTSADVLCSVYKRVISAAPQLSPAGLRLSRPLKGLSRSSIFKSIIMATDYGCMNACRV